MLCSRCVLPFLAFYLSLEEISAAALPSGSRNKREVSWLDQELFPRLPERSEQGDLSVGDAGETGRDVDGRSSHSEAFLIPGEHQRQRQSQYQYNRKKHEKRRKVAPLDSIGSFQMSSFRNQKDEPDTYLEDYRE
ncbi:hypothetical protein PAMA_013897 [Pampus argenteus]